MPLARVTLADVTLDDKYVKEAGRIYLTGVQALVRLPMLQRQRDVAAGRYFLTLANRRIRQNLAAVADNDDAQTTAAANAVLERF